MSHDDYLWDRSGKPDEDVAALERALAPLGHQPGTLGVLPSRHQPSGRPDAGLVAARRPDRAARARWRPARAMIATASIAASLSLVLYTAWFVRSIEPPEWRVSTLGGVPRVNDRAVGRSVAWRVGDRLETDQHAVAQVDVGTIGSVEVGPNSRVTMVRARVSEHRLGIDFGSIRAIIWAPPGLFVVDTPSAVAVDLGCAYTLDVAQDGSGLVRVEHGWVGFRHNGRESFIPEGAVCATRRGHGPGTPYYSDAPADLMAALTTLDFGGSADRQEALRVALASARPRDAFSVWHLLTSTDRNERGLVFDRLTRLAPAPAGVTREGVVAGNRAMLDAWWDTLGLDSASWWRMWQSPW